ncbi:Hypothetical predicted protein [Pelobates cultripes]|uniref:Uncharacterized protein n=1 Tax=Pelobates cultripes TaxID=61616 RepID=A0AAD1VPU1_PELCU|nr:Hypothetical predicted protein [Pelobates cultripes]
MEADLRPVIHRKRHHNPQYYTLVSKSISLELDHVLTSRKSSRIDRRGWIHHITRVVGKYQQLFEFSARFLRAAFLPRFSRAFWTVEYASNGPQCARRPSWISRSSAGSKLLPPFTCAHARDHGGHFLGAAISIYSGRTNTVAMEASNQDQNLQAIINAAVAASLEKALARVLPIEQKDPNIFETPLSDEDAEDSDSTKRNPSKPYKRYWKGNGPEPLKQRVHECSQRSLTYDIHSYTESKYLHFICLPWCCTWNNLLSVLNPDRVWLPPSLHYIHYR